MIKIGRLLLISLSPVGRFRLYYVRVYILGHIRKSRMTKGRLRKGHRACAYAI